MELHRGFPSWLPQPLRAPTSPFWVSEKSTTPPKRAQHHVLLAS